MKTITCYLDFISPYAYLAFEALPTALMGVSHHVVYKPVLFAGMLKHHGQLGPAEIAGKREWTYRQVLWQARQLGVRLDMPAAHPFNPLALLRLAPALWAAGKAVDPEGVQPLYIRDKVAQTTAEREAIKAAKLAGLAPEGS